MAGVNRVILLGHVGKDAEIKKISSGKKVANFSLATTESYKDKNGDRVDTTEWHNLVFWGPIVDVIEKYISKGSQVYIEGKIKTRSYDKDGEKRYVTEILGETLKMMGKAPEKATTGQAKSTGKSTSQQPVSVDGEEIDDLPF